MRWAGMQAQDIRLLILVGIESWPLGVRKLRTINFLPPGLQKTARWHSLALLLLLTDNSRKD